MLLTFPVYRTMTVEMQSKFQVDVDPELLDRGYDGSYLNLFCDAFDQESENFFDHNVSDQLQANEIILGQETDDARESPWCLLQVKEG